MFTYKRNKLQLKVPEYHTMRIREKGTNIFSWAFEIDTTCVRAI
jgi:hypothetical protein